MANKLILLPMELYKGLLKSKEDKSEDLKEKAPLQYEKATLKKIQGKRVKDASRKNLLYNQQLRRYLRSRKEARDKPLKVTFDNIPGIKFIAKRDNDPKEPVKIAMIDDEGKQEQVKIEQKKPRTRFSESEESVFLPKTPKSSQSRSSRSSRGSLSSEYSSSGYSLNNTSEQSDETPRKLSNSRRERKRKLRDWEREVENKKDRLTDLIKSNPKKFGVSGGKILHPGTSLPIAKSNLKWAIERLIHPTIKNAPSPAGMIYLKNAILKDEEASKLIHHGFTQKGKGKNFFTQKNNLFRPIKWKK